MASNPPPSGKGTPSGWALAIAAACAVCLPLTAGHEGLRTKPYRDPAAILTWCYGETQGKPEAIYTPDQCGHLLRERMGRDYAPKVLACLPQLAEPHRRNEFAALIDASYNAGHAAVCKSRMVAHMRAGNWKTGCAAFEGWYVTARNRKTDERILLRGLVRRRLDEKALCLRPEA